MQFLQKQFNVTYSLNGGLIESGASGEFENDNNEKIKYPASVRIYSQNNYEIFNEETNCDDTLKSELIFKINANSNVEAGNLTKKIKDFFKLGGVLKFDSDFPKYQVSQKSYFVLLSDTADFWIKKIDEEMKNLKK